VLEREIAARSVSMSVGMTAHLVAKMLHLLLCVTLFSALLYVLALRQLVSDSPSH
jgi:hypothetical protein